MFAARSSLSPDVEVAQGWGGPPRVLPDRLEDDFLNVIESSSRAGLRV
jgi:hypothetical protein